MSVTSWYGKKPTQVELAEILRLHGAWLRGEADGVRADLSDADLSRATLYGANLSDADLSRADLYGANLSDADLSRANLYGANLSDANLSGANLSDETRLPAGFVWKQYLEELVPQLLTAGGKKIEEVANSNTWGCHSWGRPEGQVACPIATAFGVHDLGKVPLLYREQASFFIHMFDNAKIPLERVLKNARG